MPSTVNNAAQLDEDTIDALLDSARAGDLDVLIQDIASLSRDTNSSPLPTVCAVVDPYTGNTLVHYACANGHIDILKYLLTLSTTTSTTSEAQPPQQSDELLTYITRPNENLSTPLHYAALNNQLPSIRTLLEAIPSGSARSAFVSAKNSSGRDAAFEAEMASENAEELVSYLLGVMDEADLQPSGDQMEEDEDAAQEGGVDVGTGDGVEEASHGMESMKVDGSQSSPP